MYQSLSLSLSIYIYLQKRFGSRSDPNGIQERMFRFMCDRKYSKCRKKVDANDKMGLNCIHCPVPCADPEGGIS